MVICSLIQSFLIKVLCLIYQNILCCLWLSVFTEQTLVYLPFIITYTWCYFAYFCMLHPLASNLFMNHVLANLLWCNPTWSVQYLQWIGCTAYNTPSWVIICNVFFAISSSMPNFAAIDSAIVRLYLSIIISFDINMQPNCFSSNAVNISDKTLDDSDSACSSINGLAMLCT